MEKILVIVERIEEPRQRLARKLPLAFLEEIFGDVPGWEPKADADFVAHVTRVGDRDVLVEATTTLTFESDCRRCLRPVLSEVPVVFSLNMVGRAAVRGRGIRAQQEDTGEGERAASFDLVELNQEFFDGESFDLVPLLREQLLLGLPSIEPLCKESCRGLCVTCGQDLNEGDCGHEQKPADPRWSALQDMKLQ